MLISKGNNLQFRFRLHPSCLYEDMVISDWNRIIGINPVGTMGSCNLCFTVSSGKLMLSMVSKYSGRKFQFQQTRIDRLKMVDPDTWYRGEIKLYKSADGKFRYAMYVWFDDDPYTLKWNCMDAPCSLLPLFLVKHPKLGGKYTLSEDLHIDVELM